jgi:GNAT superfamily N-acetyltransferase
LKDEEAMSLKIEILDLKTMSPALLESYSKLQIHFMQSIPRPLDLFDPKNRQLYFIGASVSDRPAGLMIMSFSQILKAADIKSLFIDESYRRQKIAGRMIQFAAEQLRSLNFKYIFATYPDHRDDTPIMESFFQKNGFSGKTMVFAEFMFEYSEFQPDWYRREYRWPPKFTAFPWTELTYYEAVKIRERYSQGAFPSAVYPFQEDPSFEPLNSFGLRHEGQLVGWLVTERISPDIISYGNLFIDHEFQSKGHSIHLLVDSLKIHYRNKIKWGMFKVNIIQASGRWLKFIRRRLAPHADFIYEYYQTTLKI